MRTVAAAAAILGGLAWIPIRAAISVTFEQPLLGLTYVEWNRVEVIPLLLMLLALMAGIRSWVATRAAAVGLWIAALGLVGMLVGVTVEFWIAGGLSGDRQLSTVGWMIYLLPGVLVHLVGMLVLGVSMLRRSGAVRWLGGLAAAIGLLHLLWISSGFVSGALLLLDQGLIGLAWMGIGVVLLARGRAV